MSKETVGKKALELQLKEAETQDPIELERAMHEDFEKHMLECAERGLKKNSGDFYIVVLTKREKLLKNVLRHYFLDLGACPTPNYDQAVYKYDKENDDISLVWVIPDRETCFVMKDNAVTIVPEERELLRYVLDFADGTLYKKCLELNGELDDERTSPHA